VSKISKIFLLLLLFGCSFNDGSRFWSKKENLATNQSDFKLLFKEETEISKEFNNDFSIKFDKLQKETIKNSYYNNNDGYQDFESSLEKISKFNFSKIDNFEKVEATLIFENDDIIFFDNKGSIFKLNKDSNSIWSTNIYSKSEKKLHPLINLDKKDNLLVAADNLGKYYAIDSKNGDIIWQKENSSPFNSQIKIYNNCILIVDANNSLKCYSLKDGRKIWSRNTEKPFISSSKKLSIAIKNKKIFFINSIGDITAVNANNGNLIWQISTRNSEIFEDIMNLKNSNLVINNESLYLSNNKNEFYSIDVNTGTINWKQNINTNLKPAIVDNLIFTISMNGYLFLIEKKSGNIVRITNIFKGLKLKIKKNLLPTGFVLNNENLFVSTNKGFLLVVDIEKGKNRKFFKIDNNNISRAFIQNKYFYLVRNNSILKLN